MEEKKKLLLVVEDEVSLANALNKKFSSEDFEVLVAKDGEEGLKKSLENHPHIILLDIIMPKLDGISMLKKLREDNWGKEVPVILLTNLSDSEKVAEGMEVGVYDYLVKSDWKIEDVVSKVKEKLGM
ncbi:MAG: response regulator [Candidatus Magasanikbacteria bacterium]|jgi:DNA-binding response OmpR family regulator|nr:response regulator [Candidatus Magasanikbacteria bacterium]MBT4071979.1 response regulator [Candidatus Magasanikbacteria bacterium]